MGLPEDPVAIGRGLEFLVAVHQIRVLVGHARFSFHLEKEQASTTEENRTNTGEQNEQNEHEKHQETKNSVEAPRGTKCRVLPFGRWVESECSLLEN